MDWTLWVILAGCVQTVVVRLAHILRDLTPGQTAAHADARAGSDESQSAGPGVGR
jgi:hypothetical protein